MSADITPMPPRGRRLLWLISLRVAIVTILLGAGMLTQVQARTTSPSDPFFLLLGITYALTVVYVLTLQRALSQRWLVDLQFGIDTCLVSALVLMTGGVTSFSPPSTCSRFWQPAPSRTVSPGSWWGFSAACCMRVWF